jgi:hypothetical protein
MQTATLKGQYRQIFDLRCFPSELYPPGPPIHTLKSFRLLLQLLGVIRIGSLTPCYMMQQGVKKNCKLGDF